MVFSTVLLSGLAAEANSLDQENDNLKEGIKAIQEMLDGVLTRAQYPYVEALVQHLNSPSYRQLWNGNVNFSGAMKSLIRDWHPKITIYVQCVRERDPESQQGDNGLLLISGVFGVTRDSHQLAVAQLYEDWKKIVKVFAPDLLEQPAVAGDDNSDTDSGASQAVKEEGTDDEKSLKSLPLSGSTNTFSPTTASQQLSYTADTGKSL